MLLLVSDLWYHCNKSGKEIHYDAKKTQCCVLTIGQALDNIFNQACLKLK